MPEYRRLYRPGGTFFFTVVTFGRAPLFNDANTLDLLHRAMADARKARPFGIDALASGDPALASSAKPPLVSGTQS